MNRIVHSRLKTLLAAAMVAVMRALLSIPGHASFAILMGLFLAKAKHHFYHGRQSQQYINLLLALLSATTAHGIYDYLALSSSENELSFGWMIGFVVILDAICLAIIHKESKNDHPMVNDK